MIKNSAASDATLRMRKWSRDVTRPVMIGPFDMPNHAFTVTLVPAAAQVADWRLGGRVSGEFSSGGLGRLASYSLQRSAKPASGEQS
jgi:hypothetical protein